MAAFDTRAGYVSSSFYGRVGAVLANIYSAIVGWNDARMTRKTLSSLSDRELDDIGLVRGDIDLAVAGRHRS